jgi:hypothetical protein
MQTELEFIGPEPTQLIASQVPFGKPFRLVNSKQDIHIRVKPTGFLLNSSVVSDVLSRGDTFVTNIQKGTLYAIEGDRAVELIDASIKIKKVR